MTNAHFGMVGLGTMGRNFLLNVAEHGFPCVGYDIDPAMRELLRAECERAADIGGRIACRPCQ
jgi:6-phosphogluconate dehydrogenase (decarboxylating)